jgi:ribosome-associated protein
MKNFMEQNVIVHSLPIRLGQFLKLANLVQDGNEAKMRIQNGEVLLNGILETRRGRQLQLNDIVIWSGKGYRVVGQ